MNRQDLGVFALETLDNLTEDEARSGADEERYLGAAFIVAFETDDGDVEVAFRTSSSDARNNIQMFQRATLIEATTWSRLEAARAVADALDQGSDGE